MDVSKPQIDRKCGSLVLYSITNGRWVTWELAQANAQEIDIGGLTVEKWGPSVGHRPMAKPVCTVGDRLVLISSLDEQYPFDGLACQVKEKG